MLMSKPEIGIRRAWSQGYRGFCSPGLKMVRVSDAEERAYTSASLGRIIQHTTHHSPASLTTDP